MKKLCIVFVCLCVLGMGIVSFAENLESLVVDVSSFVVTGDSYNPTAAEFALVIGSAVPKSLISRITLTSDDLSKPQTVTLWDGFTNGTSTAAVSKIWEWDLDGVTSVGPEIFQEYFGSGDRAYLKADWGLAATKTNGDGNVTLSIQYK